MKFKITRTSDYKDRHKTIELETLEDLVAFARKQTNQLVFKAYGDVVELEIYDSWRE